MNLIKEICVKSFDSIKDRIQISHGVAQTEFINNLKTNPSTFVPRDDWRLIDDDIIDKIHSKESNFTDISIIKIPTKCILEFESLKLKECLGYNDLYFIQNSQEYSKAVNNLISFLKEKYMVNDDYDVHNLFFGKHNLSNNTFNSSDNVFIGLHLDSWERTSFFERQNARNRICINLGREHRYLQFYNISVKTMASLISYDLSGKFDVNDIYKKFAFTFPNYPVFRIMINPYEAYIAPTEYIIHDGSNVGTKNPDVNLVIRGYFLNKSYKNSNIFKRALNFFYNE